MSPFYVVLLHHPIVNRHGEIITTSVTNMDIHDISRTSRTYAAQAYYLVTPLQDQQSIVRRILGHWDRERSEQWHPDRVEAVRGVRIANDFDQVRREIAEENGGTEPLVVLTDARPHKNSVGYAALRQELEARDGPTVVVFGTGWGVAETFLPEVDRILDPIKGVEQNGESEYRHLSVRAAAAIILDRLFGRE